MFAALPGAGPDASPPQAIRTAIETNIKAINAFGANGAFGLVNLTGGIVPSVSKITVDGMGQVPYLPVTILGLFPRSSKDQDGHVDCGGNQQTTDNWKGDQ